MMPTVTGQKVRTRNDLRCFCSRHPKLGVYGIDAKGRLYVHVKIYKQRQVYGEIICREGEIEICCRECLRWHRVNVIQPSRAALQEIPQPGEVDPPSFFQEPAK